MHMLSYQLMTQGASRNTLTCASTMVKGVINTRTRTGLVRALGGAGPQDCGTYVITYAKLTAACVRYAAVLYKGQS